MNLNEELSFSIVICTYNRDEYLERTLESLNNLNYSNFEVIVVNGPSTDNTDQVINQYRDRIKIYKNPAVNLSISRNIGIKAAQGDVVAFIDDDAIPEPNWLHQIKEVYDTHTPIGGAGGKVFGPGGDHFQFHNGIINIWGEADVKRDHPGEFIKQLDFNYNILMGVNSTFLKSALIEIGGFDEYYEYYHDESDVCVRLAKAGHPIFHHEEAYIHHEFAKSHIRTTNYKLNWYPIIKNTVYFGVKNSKGVRNVFYRIAFPLWVASKRLSEFKQWLREGNITKNDFRSFRRMCFKGMIRGFLDGFFAKRRVNFNLEEDSAFFAFNKEKKSNAKVAKMDNMNEEKYGICYLSRYYPPFHNGGVGTYTKMLAEGLAKLGYPVYVITSDLPEKEMSINGVTLISVEKISTPQLFGFIPQSMNVTKTNLEYSLKVSYIVEELYNKELIKVLESPLWDYEGFLSTNIEGLKTFVRLETPLKVAAETQNWGWNKDFELSSRLEKKFIESCTAVIPISQDIKTTIGQLYGVNWDDLKVRLVPLGIEKNQVEVNQDLLPYIREKDDINILFVGRLERRKGIDILLDVASSICQKFSNVKFIIAGNNNIPIQNNKTAMELFLNKHPHLTDRVLFLGEISEDRKRQLLLDCDIFVAPSRYESFGLVFLEAMQFGKPVVGTMVGGVKEIVLSEKIGLLVEKEDEGQLENALEKLIRSPELRRNYGEEGRKRFLNNYTQEAMVNNTLSLYKTIL
ncbi:Capsular glucan synthase [compost metagenome]